MKKFTKFVGMLLCFAMVLSFLPAAVVGAASTNLSAVTGLAAPTFGYYTDNNTDGAITEHYDAGYVPANLVDGDTSTQTRSLYYTYDEVTTGAKVPVILFELSAATAIAAVEVDTYEATYYGIDNFTIQVYTETGWVTVKEVTGAFSSAEHGTVVDPETYEFTATTGTKVRILVTKISDMSAYAEEATSGDSLATGSYIRLRGITLYEESSTDTTEPTTAATEAPTTPAAPTDPVKTGTVLQIVPASKITTQFGYYSDGTGNDTTTFVDGKDGYCVTDGWFGRAGYSECTSANGKIALVMTLSETMTIGGMEITAHDTAYDPTNFTVQALVDGAWVTVMTQTTNAFTSDRTVKFTFDTTATTNQVRILVNEVYGGTSTQCRLKEVTLYEYTTGNVSSNIDLTGRVAGSDAPAGHPASYLVDNDKSNIFLGTYVTFDLTNNGQATAIDGFNLYSYRTDANNPFPGTVTVQVQTTAGGEYTTIGSYSTNWSTGNVADILTATFDQTYMAYGVRVSFDKYAYMNGFELFGYERTADSTTDPTTPETEPVTEPVTEPTTEPATGTTDPTETPTAPAVPTDPIKTGNILQIVPASRLTAQFGYYSDYTGDDETTFVDCLDGYCATDGWFSRAAYSECTNSDGLIGLIITIDEAVTLGAIEVIAKDEAHMASCLGIQAWVDGQWVSVVSRTHDVFASGLDQMFDLRQTVTTDKIRILVYAVAVKGNECYFNEIVLHEATTGNVTQTIDLVGKGDMNDADADSPIEDLVDTNKDTEFLGSYAAFDLTVDGQATAIDGFNLYSFRADPDGRHPVPATVTVEIEKVQGGAYEAIGTFETGWTIDGVNNVLTAKFDQTYMAYAVKFTFDVWSYANEVELLQYVRETEPIVEPVNILVGASYGIHLVEPWALRTNVQFAKDTTDNIVSVSSLTSYGVYAIIGNRFEGDTVEELIADTDVIHYTSADGNIKPAGDTTLTFDFYDGLYSFNLDESVYWVAYFEDADGVYYTGLQAKSLLEVADALLADESVSETEKAILTSMKEMNDSMTALRGATADLGHIYAAGAANPGTLGERNTGYAYGTSHQLKLIEPWGIRVRVLMRDKTAAPGVYADYAAADDYGLIFYHDKTGKYGGTMTPEQMNAETGAKLYSKLDGSAWINANGVSAIYDHEIYTHELDSEMYCLPYIVIDGNYYYPSTVSCWNLLDEMVKFSQNEELEATEIAAFEAILKMYENVQNHLNK